MITAGQHRTLVSRATPSLPLLWSAWAATRVLMVLMLALPEEGATTFDLLHYHAVSNAVLHGAATSVPEWEYPIGSLLVALLVDLLSREHNGDYLVAFIAMAVTCDLVVMRALLRCTTTTSSNARGAWLWLVSSFALGPLALARLDIVACAATALGLASLASHRESVSGWTMWVGAALKIWPAFLGLNLLLVSRRRVTHLASLATVSAGLVILSLAFNWQHLMFQFVTYQRQRGVETESIWALPMLWARLLGANYRTGYEFGSMQVDGPGAAALSAAAAVVFPVSLFAALIMCRRRLRDWPLFEQVTTSGAVLLGVGLISNKVLSAQYVLWLIVVVAAGMGHARVTWRLPALLVVSSALLSHIIFPWQFAALGAGNILPIATVTLRGGFIALATCLLLRQVISAPKTPDPGLSGRPVSAASTG